jgi:hypothetical protein
MSNYLQTFKEELKMKSTTALQVNPEAQGALSLRQIQHREGM